MFTNCTAYAKVVVNKRLNTVRLLVTFDSSRRDKHNKIIVNIANAVYKTGDIASLDTYTSEQRQQAVERAIATAKSTLRTERFLLV